MVVVGGNFRSFCSNAFFFKKLEILTKNGMQLRQDKKMKPLLRRKCGKQHAFAYVRAAIAQKACRIIYREISWVIDAHKSGK